jgi:hypothetical protein
LLGRPGGKNRLVGEWSQLRSRAWSLPAVGVLLAWCPATRWVTI